MGNINEQQRLSHQARNAAASQQSAKKRMREEIAKEFKKQQEETRKRLEADKNYQREQRAKGMKQSYRAGAEMADEIMGPDGLGRLEKDKDVQAAMKEKQDIVARHKQVADEGISLAEREARRTQMGQQMGKAEQLAGLRMGGQLGGARGAGAAAQQRSMMQAGMAGRANIERDIFLAAEEAKRGGLKSYTAAHDSYTSSLGEMKTFDMGQAAKEAGIRMTVGMGFVEQDMAIEAAQREAEAAKAAAAARSCFLPGTPINMADGSVKEIQEIQPGDIVKNGGEVSAVGYAKASEFYMWNKVIVAAGHAVKDKWGWVNIELSDDAYPLDLGENVVFNLLCENHELEITEAEGARVGDFWDATDISYWAKIYVPYKKLKKGIYGVLSKIFRRGRKKATIPN